MNEAYCEVGARKWNGAYNSDGRCVTGGSPVRLEAREAGPADEEAFS
ncbi:hypothetical protein GCM10027040_13910 [Halomonas shantousis]